MANLETVGRDPCSLENMYVKDVYDKIGDNFSHTRHSTWPGVREFIMSLPENSMVLDAGCGNGKNMQIRKSIDIIGCDLSETLLEICKDKGLNVVKANIIDLPFKNESFDAVICIAVLHHLSTYERRQLAFNELFRVVKPGGKIYIEVWAYEQKLSKKFISVENTDKDYFVTWDNKYKRFYHLFDKDEMIKMFSPMNADIEYTKDNWVAILTK
jgi:alkylated DNA repair protein alkB family protein 8